VHGERGAAPGAFVRRAPLVALDAPEGAPARDVVEGGRTVFDSAGLELARDPVHPATVLVRTVSGLAARVLVTVDAGPAREIVIDPPGSGAFVDVPIATLAPGTGRAHVRLARPGGAVEGSPLVLAHVFAVVPEGSGG
jgi:hypothetical protein